MMRKKCYHNIKKSKLQVVIFFQTLFMSSNPANISNRAPLPIHQSKNGFVLVATTVTS